MQNWSCYLPHWKENLYLLQRGTDLAPLPPDCIHCLRLKRLPPLPSSPPVHFARSEETSRSHGTHFAFANTIMLERYFSGFIDLGNSPLRKKKKYPEATYSKSHVYG